MQVSKFEAIISELLDIPGVVAKRYAELQIGDEIMAFLGNHYRRCRVAKAPELDADSPERVKILLHYSRRPESAKSVRFCKEGIVAVFPDRSIEPIRRQSGSSATTEKRRRSPINYQDKILALLESSSKTRTLLDIADLLKIDYPGVRFAIRDLRDACNELAEAGMIRQRKQGTRFVYSPLPKLRVNDRVVENQGSPNMRYGWIERFIDYRSGDQILSLPVVQFINAVRSLSSAAMLDLVKEDHLIGQIDAARRAACGEQIQLPPGVHPLPWYLICQLRWNDKGRTVIDEEIIVEIAKHLSWVKPDYQFIGRAAPLIRNQVIGHLDRYYPDWRSTPLRVDVPEYVKSRRKKHHLNRQNLDQEAVG